MHVKTIAAVAAAGLLALALPATAQVTFQKPEDAIKYRQGAYTLMGVHFGRLAAMAQGKMPYDAKVAADDAAIVAAVARLPQHAFATGTERGAPTRAKAEVWSDSTKFRGAMDKMLGEVTKLETAARAGNLDALKPAVSAVGGSCKGCHDDFRAEKYASN